MDHTLFLLMLQRLPNTGAATLQKLVGCFGNVASIAAAPHRELSAIIQGEALAAFEQFREKGERSRPGQRALKDRDWLIKNNCSMLSIDDGDYPGFLKEIHAAPALLMVCGDMQVLQQKQIAIVGSRKASPSGLEHAQYFASELVACGFVITSGMALGIDAAAHRGALLAKNDTTHKTTIAVIATGMDVCYPARNEKLFRDICENGAVISEFPLGTAPQKENFPRRNRIISGMAQGILVVEAEEKSGSLISARYAIEQNREVFAIPGSIKNPGSRGCHQLIREGAKLVETVDDILSELEHPFGQISLLNKRNPIHMPIAKSQFVQTAGVEKEELDENEKKLLLYLDDAGVSIDELSRRASIPIDKTTSLLLSLEIKGWVEVSPEGYRQQ